MLLAHALGMRVAAQRVSDADQLRHLRAAGCDLVASPEAGEVDVADEEHLPHDVGHDGGEDEGTAPCRLCLIDTRRDESQGREEPDQAAQAEGEPDDLAG